MITEFQRFDDKIIAYDDKNGLINYNYQDNVEEILKQKNVIEKIENILIELNNKKSCVNVNKNNFILMLFMEEYGMKAWAFYFCSVLIIFLASVISLGFIGNVIRLIALTGMLTTFPAIVYQYKKYKNDMELNLINIDEQIKEFEKKLEKEIDLLKTLMNNKTNNKEIDTSKKVIDNAKNDKLLNIEKEKLLYETYRKWCYVFQKNKEYKLLKNGKVNNEDLIIMKEMSNRAVKALVKEK